MDVHALWNIGPLSTDFLATLLLVFTIRILFLSRKTKVTPSLLFELAIMLALEATVYIGWIELLGIFKGLLTYGTGLAVSFTLSVMFHLYPVRRFKKNQFQIATRLAIFFPPILIAASLLL